VKKIISIWVLLISLNMNASELIDPDNILGQLDLILGGMTYDDTFVPGEKVTRLEIYCSNEKEDDCASGLSINKVLEKNDQFVEVKIQSSNELDYFQITKNDYESINGNFLRYIFMDEKFKGELLSSMLHDKNIRDSSYHLVSYKTSTSEYFGQLRKVVMVQMLLSGVEDGFNVSIPFQVELVAGVSFLAQLKSVNVNFGAGSYNQYAIEYEQ